MLKFVLLACVATVVVTQQHIAHGSIGFLVDEHAKEMIMVSHTHCFLYPLTDDQLKASRDPAELEKLELKVSGLAADMSKHHNVTMQTDRLIHARCRGKDLTELMD